MNVFAPLAQLLPQNDPGKTEFKHGDFVIRDNTLTVGEAIYSVANVSSVVVADLRRTLHWSFWVLVGLGVLAIMAGGIAPFFAIPLFYGAVYPLVTFLVSLKTTDFALAISMNGGGVATVYSNNFDFLKAIALELYRLMELNVASNSVFNIDRSVKLDGITGSTVSIGHVSGDLVNTVLAGA